jgi:hypothetical protein
MELAEFYKKDCSAKPDSNKKTAIYKVAFAVFFIGGTPKK